MKVILLENVDKVGLAGEVVDVKRGYAQNYLIKHNLALPKTPENMNIVKTRRKAFEAKAAQALAAAEELAAQLNGKEIKIPVKAGEGDRLYGAVTASDLAEKLAEEGFKLDKRNIKLAEPIKNLGDYQVELKLHPEVKTEVKVQLIRQED
ncbi:MAG: 50S ribosomal protein L9 [Eubacteriales bacterium]|nr:50S ribosomal protein L9 [Eubacteriales bacterium]